MKLLLTKSWAKCLPYQSGIALQTYTQAPSENFCESSFVLLWNKYKMLFSQYLEKKERQQLLCEQFLFQTGITECFQLPALRSVQHF